MVRAMELRLPDQLVRIDPAGCITRVRAMAETRMLDDDDARLVPVLDDDVDDYSAFLPSPTVKVVGGTDTHNKAQMEDVKNELADAKQHVQQLQSKYSDLKRNMDLEIEALRNKNFALFDELRHAEKRIEELMHFASISPVHCIIQNNEVLIQGGECPGNELVTVPEPPSSSSSCAATRTVLIAAREFQDLTPTERKKLSVTAAKEYAARLQIEYKGTKTIMLDVLEQTSKAALS